MGWRSNCLFGMLIRKICCRNEGVEALNQEVMVSNLSALEGFRDNERTDQTNRV
jgi:hypothetical protein